jgi:hypothetical protein
MNVKQTFSLAPNNVGIPSALWRVATIQRRVRRGSREFKARRLALCLDALLADTQSVTQQCPNEIKHIDLGRNGKAGEKAVTGIGSYPDHSVTLAINRKAGCGASLLPFLGSKPSKGLISRRRFRWSHGWSFVAVVTLSLCHLISS